MFDRFEPDDEGSSELEDGPEAGMAPTVDDPAEDLAPSIPKANDYSEVDAPRELKQEFWAQVLLFNVALFALSLGLMFIGFRGEWKLGGGLVVVGLFAMVRGLGRYRAVKRDPDWVDDEDADHEDG